MDLYGANFELLSALKPCSLLCAANDVCRLHLTQALVPAGAVGGCKEAEEWSRDEFCPVGPLWAVCADIRECITGSGGGCFVLHDLSQEPTRFPKPL